VAVLMGTPHAPLPHIHHFTMGIYASYRLIGVMRWGGPNGRTSEKQVYLSVQNEDRFY